MNALETLLRFEPKTGDCLIVKDSTGKTLYTEIFNLESPEPKDPKKAEKVRDLLNSDLEFLEVEPDDTGKNVLIFVHLELR